MRRSNQPNANGVRLDCANAKPSLPANRKTPSPAPSSLVLSEHSVLLSNQWQVSTAFSSPLLNFSIFYTN